MKNQLYGAIVFTLLTTFAAATPPEEAIDETRALGILSRNCAACHQASDHPGALFLNKANLSEKATLDLMIRLIETNQMPPVHGKFKGTADGKTLLAWLKSELAKKQQKGTGIKH